jgi:CRISPR-associated protein Csb2
MDVTLLGGTYEASLDATPEWPPHPGRLFSALVAQAQPGTTDDDALRWLEEQDPPVVLASLAEPSTTQAYVPTNVVGKTAKADTHQTYLGRTSGSRTWRRMHPAADTVRLVWESAEPPAGVASSLRRLCRQIPYLGRSTTPVVVSLAEQADRVEGLQRLESPGDGTLRLRVPAPSSLAALRGAYELGESARSVDRWVVYGPPAQIVEEGPAAVDGPWPELLTFGLPPGVALDGRLIVRIAIAWRSAVLSVLGRQHDPVELALLNGHHDGTSRQCAFLPLPSVGGEHADGQVRGLGLALSPDLPPPVRRSLLRLLGMDVERPRLTDFTVPGLLDTPQPLTHGPMDGRQVVRPDRWSRSAGWTSWTTVSPLVLDRYPHRNEDIVEHVRQACAFAGYPDPVHIDVLSSSPLAGAARLRRSDLVRRAGDSRRPHVHCRLTFGVPVRGPVVLGHLRHLGVGLCLPVDDPSPAEVADGAAT